MKFIQIIFVLISFILLVKNLNLNANKKIKIRLRKQIYNTDNKTNTNNTNNTVIRENDEESEENSRTSSDSLANNQEVSTLIEVPVSYTTGISYYYPYFYKARLISFHDDSNIFFNPTTATDIYNKTCSANCDLCSLNTADSNFNKKSTTTGCLKCSSGYYLNDGACVEYCPNGKLADILRAKCIPSEMSDKVDIVYTMAYSVGSCRNMCGKVVEDCSCAQSCKSKGNCCTNYDVVNCDFVIDKSSKLDKNKCKDSGCELCEVNVLNETSYKCSQCSEDKFLHNGFCVNACPAGFSSNGVNKVCMADPLDCPTTIPQCDQCFELVLGGVPLDNPTSKENIRIMCRRCKRGTFLYDNKCLDKCPVGFRGDRITWSCLEPPVFGWYWVYPTKNSCRNKCTVKDLDTCSCSKECIQDGSCCPDFDFYCQNRNSKSDNRKNNKMSSINSNATVLKNK